MINNKIPFLDVAIELKPKEFTTYLYKKPPVRTLVF